MSGDLNLGVSPGQSGELLHASLKHGIWSHVFCSMAMSLWASERQTAAFALDHAPTFQKWWKSAISTAFCTVSHWSLPGESCPWVLHDTLLARAATRHFSSLPLGYLTVWLSDTRCQRYIKLQSLVKCLDHTDIVSVTICSQARLC